MSVQRNINTPESVLGSALRQSHPSGLGGFANRNLPYPSRPPSSTSGITAEEISEYYWVHRLSPISFSLTKGLNDTSSLPPLSDVVDSTRSEAFSGTVLTSTSLTLHGGLEGSKAIELQRFTPDRRGLDSTCKIHAEDGNERCKFPVQWDGVVKTIFTVPSGSALLGLQKDFCEAVPETIKIAFTSITSCERGGYFVDFQRTLYWAYWDSTIGVIELTLPRESGGGNAHEGLRFVVISGFDALHSYISDLREWVRGKGYHLERYELEKLSDH